MQTSDGSSASIGPLGGDGRSPDSQLTSTLVARVDAIEALLRGTREIVDEKTLKELRRTIEALAKRDPKFEERVTNKVDVVADRVETLAKTVSTSSAGLVAKEGEIIQLRRELAAGLAQLNAAVPQVGRGADAAELAEIKNALAELSQLTKHKLPRGLEGRVEELTGKLTLLGQRVDSLSTTISTTAAGAAGRDGDVAALRRLVETDRDRVAGELAELRRAVDPTPVDELREALKTHSDETARRLHSTRQLVAQTGASVDALGARLEELTASVSSTTDKASATEAGLAAFRTYFEDAGRQLSAHVAEHQRALAALSARAVALEQADEDGAGAIASVADKIDGVAARVDAIADTLSETESRISGHEDGVSALRAHVDETGRRLGSLLASQQQSLDAFDSRTEVLERAGSDVARLLEERSAASARIDELGLRLEELSAAVATASERSDARDADLHELERRFREATSRVDGLVAELSRALAEVPDPGARLDEQADELASVADRVARAEAALSEQLRRSASAAELEPLLMETRATASDLSLRFDALTTSLTALSARAGALEQADEDGARALEEQFVSVTAKVDGLAGRVESLAETLSATADRVSGSEQDVSAVRDYVEGAGKRLGRLVEEHTQSLAAFGERAAALERSGDELAGLSQRVDSLAESIGSAASSLEQKERELASLHDHFTESSARIESVVDDIRAALSAFPAVEPATMDDLGPYVERLSADLSSLGDRMDQLESAVREATDAPERRVVEITGRLDLIDRRVGAVAAEVARAKTLWPVALRSLEARLDDAVSHTRPPAEAGGTAPAARSGTPDDDLLTGLRDSLQAMETVAAEMARASDALGGSEDEGAAQSAQVATTGATVVPLRATEP